VATFGDGPFGSASVSGLGSTAHLAIGGTIAPGLALAGVLQGATRSGSTFSGGPSVQVTTTKVVNGQSQTTTSNTSGHASTAAFLLGLQVDWFPRPEDGWHVGASLGLGGVQVTDDASSTIDSVTVAASLFGGYQWWIGPSWSLGLSAVLLGVPKANLQDSQRNDSGYRMSALSGGLEAVLLYY
jgi:hypothetical protein